MAFNLFTETVSPVRVEFGSILAIRLFIVLTHAQISDYLKLNTCGLIWKQTKVL